MKIYDDPSDQCLLCIGYDFKDDYPLQREIALRQYKDGVKQKEWWRYHHSYLGLKTWVAYQGIKPVGHIELMPIEHAPRPIAGKDTMVINCLHVDEKAQDHGIGSALLAVAEEFSFSRGKGIAAIAWQSGDFMPLAFYDHMGYQIISSRRDEFLVHKPYDGSTTPSFIPIGYQPILVKDKTSIVYYHCPQCPRSGWALKVLKETLKDHQDQILLQVFKTGDRKEVERLGIDHRAYINGRPTDHFPIDPELLIHDIELELVQGLN
jgi:GNAT superfamily N-acetyltransferase